MDLKKNKSGFTLIELLAVIVILAVIILIASSNIGGMMTAARKNALAVEGDTLVSTAKSAYQIEVLNGNITTGTACFSLEYLYGSGLFDKGAKDSYHGSVLIVPDASGVQYTYTAWISNGSYSISNAELGKINGGVATVSATAASQDCGGKTGLKLFSKAGQAPTTK